MKITNKPNFYEDALSVETLETGTCNDIYHFVFEQATDAIIISDFEGNLVDVNQSVCTMFGYTKAELLRLNVKSLLHPEHIKHCPIRFDLLAGGQNLITERQMLHRDGTIVYVEANSKKIKDNRILVIAHDITELKKVTRILKKSEANLNTIFDTTDTIYVLMDHDLRVMAYNQRAAAFADNELGHTLEISEYFLDYFPIEKHPQLLIHIETVLTGKHINYEVSYPQPNGSFNWYHVRILPITQAENNLYGLMMAVSDITEKKVLEQKLEEERVQKQMEITDAVITAAENERHHIGLELHDNVNQLLATARIYLGIARASERETSFPMMDEVDKFIQNAIEEIRGLSHSMIPAFLDEFGLLESLDHLTVTITKGSGLVVKKQMDIDENIIEQKLKSALYRIVQEQLNNICKHAKATIIELELKQVNNNIRLSIKDDGIGFDCSMKSKGIGLMNIRTRASLFNGKVEIVSKPGSGCQLIVSIPLN